MAVCVYLVHRMCAVFGGVYCLRRQVAAAVLDDSNRCVELCVVILLSLIHFSCLALV